MSIARSSIRSVITGRTTSLLPQNRYSVDSTDVSPWHRTRFSKVLVVFRHVIFCCLQVHTPATFPFIFLARRVVKDVTCVAVLEAFNFVSFKED